MLASSRWEIRAPESWLCVLNLLMRTREYLFLEGAAGLNEKSHESLSTLLEQSEPGP